MCLLATSLRSRDGCMDRYILLVNECNKHVDSVQDMAMVCRHVRNHMRLLFDGDEAAAVRMAVAVTKAIDQEVTLSC